MSDKTNAPRTLDNVVGEIKEALTKAGVPEPYIFVSHSMGGFYATEYAIRYPEKVNSMIFIDNSPPSLFLNDSSELDLIKSMSDKLMFHNFVGLSRFSEKKQIPGLTPEEQEAFNYYDREMFINKTIVNEIDHTLDNAALLEEKTVPDSIPMLFLLFEQNEKMSIESGWEKTWFVYHEELMNKNPRSEVKTFNAGHYIYMELPEKVLTAIDEFETNSK